MQYERLKYGWTFFRASLRGFSANRCSSVAAELTMTSLLALVPLSAVVFTLLTAIPDFKALGLEAQTLLFKYFVPETGETVQQAINEFVVKAKGLSGFGFLMLLVTALLLMRTIDLSFNRIWQVKTRQSRVRTFLVYWAVITLGPLLLGASLILTSYVKSLPLFSQVVVENSQWLSLGLPFLMANLAFSVMFYVIPNRQVSLLHALFSGALTAILFEVAKSLFGIFVSSFSTYQFIFGALAVVPLFLIWVYICWAIILYGAVFCYQLESFSPDQKLLSQHPLLMLLSWLVILAEKQQEGELLTECSMEQLCRAQPELSDQQGLARLVLSGLVSRNEQQSYCLVGAASDLNFYDLYRLADHSMPSINQVHESNLPESVKQKLALLVCQTVQQLSTCRVV